LPGFLYVITEVMHRFWLLCVFCCQPTRSPRRPRSVTQSKWGQTEEDSSSVIWPFLQFFYLFFFFFGCLLKAGPWLPYLLSYSPHRSVLSLPLQRSIILPISQIVEQLYSFPSSCWFSLHSSFKNFLQKFVVSKHMTYPFMFPLSSHSTYSCFRLLSSRHPRLSLCPSSLSFPFFAKSTFLELRFYLYPLVSVLPQPNGFVW